MTHRERLKIAICMLLAMLAYGALIFIDAAHLPPIR